MASTLDYGHVGFVLVFGWAFSAGTSATLTKFERWLSAVPASTVVARSVMTSVGDDRVYFEAVVPCSEHQTWLARLERFSQPPYGFGLRYDLARLLGHHINLSGFDGTRWAHYDGFRLEAVADAAGRYAEVLPMLTNTVEQTRCREPQPQEVVAAAALESDYHVSSKTVHGLLVHLGLPPVSKRTLRRALARLRSVAVQPFADIRRIGLTQRLLLCFEGAPSDSPVSRTLQAQAMLLPRVRIVSGDGLTVLDLSLPSTANWLTVSRLMRRLAGKGIPHCTMVVDPSLTRKGLVQVLWGV